jgi:MFS family permease
MDGIAAVAKGGIYRGWWVVIAGFLALFISLGSLGGALPIFNATLEKEIGWDRGLLAIGYACFLFGAGVASPLTGLFVERLGSRKIMSIGATGMIVFVLLMAMIQDLVQFYVVMFCMGTTLAAVSMVPVQKMVTEWFIASRGAAMGLAMAGAPLGTAVMAIVASMLIPAAGWRTSFYLYAAALLIVMAPMLIWVIRNRPRDVGLLPLGATPKMEGAEQGDPDDTPAGPGLAHTLLSPGFIFVLFIVLLSSLGTGAPPVHFAFLAQDQGFDLGTAAIVVAVFASGNVLGTLFFGWLADRANKRLVISFVNVLGGLAVWTMLIYGNLPLLLVAAFAFGLAWGSLFALWPVLLAERFGNVNFAVLMGVLSLAVIFGWAIAPVAAGIDFVANGSYNLSFGTLATLMILAGLLIAVIKPRASQVAAPTAD